MLQKIKGYIEITKVTENDNKYTGLSAGTPLAGVTFEVYNDKNELLETLVTDENGQATTGILYKGIYTVKEKDTGNKFYLLND